MPVVGRVTGGCNPMQQTLQDDTVFYGSGIMDTILYI